MCSAGTLPATDLFARLDRIRQQYMGCASYFGNYGINPASLGLTPKALSIVTPDHCNSACALSGFKYAALNAQQCYCANTISTSGYSWGSPTGCNVPCADDASQTCGGPRTPTAQSCVPSYGGYVSCYYRYEVLNIAYYLLDQNGAHLGCYEDDTDWWSRVFEKASFSLSNLTPLLCASMCYDRNPDWVAGLQYGGECRCYEVRAKFAT